MVLVSAFVLAMAVPMAATGKEKDEAKLKGAFVPVTLLQQAQKDPDALYPVIVQGAKGKKGSDVGNVIESVASNAKGKKGKLGNAFKHVAAASAQLTGAQILELAAKSNDVSAITPDVKMRASGLEFTTREKWPYATGAPLEWVTSTTQVKQAPTIAFIDSGIEAGRPEFGGRVIEQVTMTSLTPNSPGDGRGHGTFVAAIAAGGLKGKAGVSPASKIVMIDVMDDNGMAMTSDVIHAVDYVIANKDRLGIKVLNLSLHATTPASIMFDPLDRAVEQAWFSGIVVVAAAGNYRTAAGPSGVQFAPGNDPFIITVGAADIGKDPLRTNDEFAAPWSAYGYTLDGFAKPEIGAPGRYMNGPVPLNSTLYAERVASRVGTTGYLQMSGTSFAAPVTAGAAALVLAGNPTYTPDQVKGALMLAAKPAPNAAPMSLGVGIVNIPKAVDVRDAPNPNAALNRFVTVDSVTGQKAFDAASWSSVAQSDASWSSASWSSASWSSASWSSASWSSASWSSASWSSASWSSSSIADASWSSASWSSASWSSASVSVNADSDPTLPEAEVAATDAEIAAFEIENGLAVSVLTGESLVTAEPTPVTSSVEPTTTTVGTGL